MSTHSIHIVRKGIPALVKSKGGGLLELISLFRANRDEWDAMACQHGGVLFKGFNMDTFEKFQDFIRVAAPRAMAYVQGDSPRLKLARNVYTSTEYPKELFLALHNELSYTKKWPSYLFFCCIRPADSGGETPIADSRAILESLPESILKVFNQKSIRYIRNLPYTTGPGLNWRKVFETESRQVAEEYCRRDGIQFYWQADGTMRLVEVRPATITHRKDGEPVWFNQADNFHPSNHPAPLREAMLDIYRDDLEALPHFVTYGDGTPIETATLEAIRKTVSRHVFPVKWEKGDLLFLDNERACHGRNPFEGDRRILVAMEGPC